MGSCSSKKSAGKEAVVTGERELRDTIQSSEVLEVSGLRVSEAGDSVKGKKSGEVDATMAVDVKFSNKDDVITQDQETSSLRVETKEGDKSKEHTIGVVGKDKGERDATRTDIKPSILL